MYSIIVDAFYVFFNVLEGILFLYILSRWIRVSQKVNDLLTILLGPVLDPIRYLLKHSIFQVRNYDISPIIGFIIISYLQKFFFTLR